MSRKPPDTADAASRGDLAKVLEEPRLQRLLGVLNGDGEETRVVGGAVRNALLGLPVKDVDLTTTALPEITTRRAEAAGLKVVPTGIEHGTVTVIVKGAPFEVTTLRRMSRPTGASPWCATAAISQPMRTGATSPSTRSR